MKKVIITLIFSSSFMIFSTGVSAQKMAKKLSFGFGLEGGITNGKTKDIYPANGGLTLRFSYRAGPGFATLTSGALAFIPKSLDGEDVKVGILIPVRAGYKYIYKNHFFGMGEIGYGSFKQYYADNNDDIQSISNGGFLFAPSIGVQFGAFEIGLRYESLSLPGGTLSTLGARLGFNF